MFKRSDRQYGSGCWQVLQVLLLASMGCVACTQPSRNDVSIAKEDGSRGQEEPSGSAPAAQADKREVEQANPTAQPSKQSPVNGAQPQEGTREGAKGQESLAAVSERRERRVAASDGKSPAGETAEQEECRKTGGEWGTWGRAQRTYCMPVRADAGKKCSDSSECSGRCIKPTNATQPSCEKYKTTFGCAAEFRDGKAGPVRCQD